MESSEGGEARGEDSSEDNVEAGPGCSREQDDHESSILHDSDIIDLRPHSDSDSDSKEDAQGGEEASGSGLFKKRKLSNSRNYRRNNNDDAEANEDSHSGGLSPCPNDAAGTSEGAPVATEDTDQIPSLDNSFISSHDEDVEDNEEPTSSVRARRIIRAEDLDSSDTEEGEDEDEEAEEAASNDNDIQDQVRAVLERRPGPPRHNLLRDRHALQLGRGARLRPSFTRRQISSLDLVSRLQLAARLEAHEGCVNSLSFNTAGSKIASGSDDLNIIIWDWERKRKLLQYNTGHRANVFQSKIMPGDLLISSCSRDGQVRLAELSTTGSLRSTKKLAQHKGPAHKMSLIPECHQCLLSAGEDGQVFMVDIREQKPDKILLLKNEKDKKVPIYSIHTNPANGNQFCTTGRDQYIRVFDRRYLAAAETGGSQIVKHCPAHLRAVNEFKAYITCAVFSCDGREVLGSYNDEDIYLFNTADPEGADQAHQYRGHRNSATVKGVNFYGSGSEFVVSGSDCGNIFVWDKASEAVVRLVHGDQGGVVNVLEPHPSLPVLATSGLDDDVKIWRPGPAHTEEDVKKQQEYIRKTIQKNLSDREDQRSSEADPLDGQMLWVLWRHIRRAERRRREAASARGEEETLSDNESSASEEDEESEGEEGPRGRMCAQS